MASKSTSNPLPIPDAVPDGSSSTLPVPEPEPQPSSSNEPQPSTSSQPDRSEANDLPPSERKKQHFLVKWLTDFKWLRYEEEDNYMFCNLCTEYNKSTSMHKSQKCTNFQKSTLVRHAASKEHESCHNIPALQRDLKQSQQKVSSQQDKAAITLLKSTHWLAQEGLPLSKFESLTTLMTELGVPELAVLQQKPDSRYTYSSRYMATEMLSSLAECVDSLLKKAVAESPFVTVLADESTDITNHKRLVVYIQTLDANFKPRTYFVTNKECKDATGAGIASAIEEIMCQLNVPMTKVMSMGSDGASVMTGRNRGCTGMLLRSNPHMVNVHCVAHSLALCTSQAAEGIQELKQHQQILTDLFYYFRGSPKRAAKIKEIQELLDDPVLTYKELHSVRWLSYYNALSAVHKTNDSLLSYLSEASVDIGKDPKANGLKRKIATEKFITITAMMMDIMAPVTILSQFLQTENVDVALVKVKLDLTISDLQEIKSMNSPNMAALQQDIAGNVYKGQHHITTSTLDMENLCIRFIDQLVDNMHARFPDTSLLASFGVLSLRPISFLSPDELKAFGNEELELLIAHYGQEQTHSWKEDGVEHHKTSPPMINPSQTRQEWVLLKNVVLVQHYPRDKIWHLWSLVTKYHMEDFPNLVKLAQLAATLAVHTAGCERGFSAQNLILTPHRNRLSVAMQDQLLKVNLGPPRGEFPFPIALENWKGAKQRKLYSMKFQPWNMNKLTNWFVVRMTYSFMKSHCFNKQFRIFRLSVWGWSYIYSGYFRISYICMVNSGLIN